MKSFLPTLLSYKGRMSRKQYTLTNIALLFLLYVLSKVQVTGIITLPEAVNTAIFVPMGIIRLFCDVKRLRDTNLPIFTLLFMLALISFLPEFLLQIILIFTLTLTLIKSATPIDKSTGQPMNFFQPEEKSIPPKEAAPTDESAKI